MVDVLVLGANVLRRMGSSPIKSIYTPGGIRIPVSSVKGRGPWPLDDRGSECVLRTDPIEP